MMQHATSSDAAYQVAKEFLSRQRAKSGILAEPLWMSRELSPEPFVFWWDDDNALIEFPMYDTETGRDAGYLIVSGSKNLPPIIEHATRGVRRSAELYHLLLSSCSAAQADLALKRVYYFSATELIYRVHTDNDKDVFVRIHSQERVEMSRTERISRDVSRFWDSGELSRQWDDLQNWKVKPLGYEMIIPVKIPVPYNQSCCMCAGGEGSGQYCAPAAIMGCVPVAWAMVASCWKKATWIPGTDRIFSGSTDWSVGWPTPTPPRPASAAVQNAMLRWHAKCDTDCNGGTSEGDVWDGHDVFSELFGLGWEWEKLDGDEANFDNARYHLDQLKPLLFAGHGNWQQYLSTLERSRFQGGGGDGHATVAYGYRLDTAQFYICLGWGRDVSDKWVSLYSFANRQFVHPVKF